MYEPEAHIAAGRIIARHSTNRTDIREVIRDQIPFDRTDQMLDLGCGYGFIYDVLQGCLRAGTTVVGIDRNEENRSHFLARVTRCGGAPEFRPMGLPSGLDWPDASFDTVLSIFSLYFFTGMLSEVRRLLKPGGSFIAVTHCGDSFRELNDIVADHRVFGVLENFSDANALEILSPHFRTIHALRYENRLRFTRNDADDVASYLRFKRPEWMDDARADSIIAKTRELLSRQELVVTKNDMIYVCMP